MAQKLQEKETQDDFIIYSRAITLKIKKKKIKKRGYQLSMLIKKKNMRSFSKQAKEAIARQERSR